MAKKRVNLVISRDLHTKAKMLAITKGSNFSELVSGLIAAELSRGQTTEEMLLGLLDGKLRTRRAGAGASAQVAGALAAAGVARDAGGRRPRGVRSPNASDPRDVKIARVPQEKAD